MTIEVHCSDFCSLFFWKPNFFKQLFNLLNLNLWEPLYEQWLKVVKIYENLSGDLRASSRSLLVCPAKPVWSLAPAIVANYGFKVQAFSVN